MNEDKGSDAQFDFASTMPSQALPGMMPSAIQLPSNIHFTLYAFELDPMAGRLFAVQDFEIHRIIDPSSPCFIDVGEHVAYPGLHITQYEKMVDQDTGISDYMNPPPGATMEQQVRAGTAHQRMLNIDKYASDATGINAVTSASTAEYPMADTGCTDTTKIPAPTCTDADSNKRRLAMCQDFWSKHPGFYEGTDVVLTKPLAGTNYGLVHGFNPINNAPIGGTEMFVDEALTGFNGFAVYWQYDDANGDGTPDYPMGVTPPPQPDPGTMLLFGRPMMPTRGVIHTHMTSTVIPSLTAELAIFANLDQDSTHF